MTCAENIASVARELEAVLHTRHGNVTVTRFWLNAIVNRLRATSVEVARLERTIDDLVAEAQEELDAIERQGRAVPHHPRLSVIPGGREPEPPAAA